MIEYSRTTPELAVSLMNHSLHMEQDASSIEK